MPARAANQAGVRRVNMVLVSCCWPPDGICAERKRTVKCTEPSTTSPLFGNMGESPCAKCRILDVRWDLRSRQSEGSLSAFQHPETYWYAQEYLVERLAP